MVAASQDTPRPGKDLLGAYVELDDLLALRTVPTPRERRRRERTNSGGERLSRLRGRGIDFAEVRAYQPGDDVRTIDWRVTARKNKPHTKIFREERERPTLIYVDQTHTMFFGSRRRLKSVAAAELAARLAWRCLEGGDRVGGLVSGVDGRSILRPLRSPKAVARLLGEIARHNHALHRQANRQGADRLGDDLGRLRQLARSQHRIYLLTDLLPVGAGWLETLQALAQHNDVVLIHVTDPLEADLPAVDSFVVTDATQRLTVEARDNRLKADYREAFDQREQSFRTRLRQLGIPYRQISTPQRLDLARLGL